MVRPRHRMFDRNEVVTANSVHPLPLRERVAVSQANCRVRGLSPRIETPHPPPAAAPSLARGEGKAESVAADGFNTLRDRIVA